MTVVVLHAVQISNSHTPHDVQERRHGTRIRRALLHR